MASRSQTEFVRPGDLLLVVHEFQARSPDELTLARGDRVELIERDDDFGDGWFLGRNTESGDSGLFPEVYTRIAPKSTFTAAMHHRAPSQPTAHSTQHEQLRPVDIEAAPTSAPLPLTNSSTSIPLEPPSSTEPLQIPPPSPVAQASPTNRISAPSQPRSISQTLSGDLPRDDETINSPVMHETLSVIDEHITDMSTPRHSATGKDLRQMLTNDSGSEYSSHHRLSYINGQETDEEEHGFHTEQEVFKWSPARVAEYLEDVGVEKKHCDIFKEQEINGEALLSMDQATIFLKEFELGPVGPRLRTWVKIKALQQEVKNAKDAARAMAAFDGPEESARDRDVARNRATSMSAVLPRIPSLRDGQVMKSTHMKPSIPRANSSASHSPPMHFMEGASPYINHTPPSPVPGTPTRPSAASIRSLNHNRRHSSIDSTMNMPTPTSAGAMKLPPTSSSHKKAPSFDRGWTMGAPQSPGQEQRRPSSSHQEKEGMMYNRRESGVSSMAAADLERGYFSGGEVDNRKSRNVLRKSPSHSRNPSFNTESGRRSTYSRRHSRIGSTGSGPGVPGAVSPAAKAYFGSSIKGNRSSNNFEFVRPLKPMSDDPPTVTKLPEYKSSSIDAIANSPRVPTSESSSQGRASPSPAAQTHSHSFFSKKSRGIGLRAISDAITGSERASVSAGDINAPMKDSPLQSPTRTGSTTPSATSNSKSFDLEHPDQSKKATSGSAAKDGKKRAKKHNTSAYLRGREQITPQEAMQGCDYSGWMKKKSSSLMTTWKTRLFVLRGRRLSYFYTENDTEEKGLIDISSHRVLPANNERITGFHATLTRAASSPTSPQGATIPTAASAANANGIEEDMAGMFIFKLVPPRAGLQKGVQFTKPIVHYFAVDSIQAGRLWMAALMKATIDRDDSLAITTTYQQKTISLDKARAMRQRPPALMDEEGGENASVDIESRQSIKESIQDSVIHEEDEKQGLAISGLDDAKALLDYAENGIADSEPPSTRPTTVESSSSERKRAHSVTPGLVSIA